MDQFKKAVSTVFFFTMLLAVLPAASLALFDSRQNAAGSLVSQSCLGMERGASFVTVKLASSGKSIVMSRSEYLCGVVASQMPMEYGDEALKAQTVASYTLMKYGELSPSQDLTGRSQSFLTGSQLQSLWGSDFEKNDARLKRLVDSVAGEYLSFEGRPILAAYHRLSSGVTEDAGNVWPGEYPCLVPADSPSDRQAEDYRSSVGLTEEEFAAVCREKLGVIPEGDASGWLGACLRSDSGYVLSCRIGGQSFTGQRIRNSFGLRSACFTLKRADGRFVFDVKGFGHGVGMSQYGANQLAAGGATYREILTHYYRGAEILRDEDSF